MQNLKFLLIPLLASPSVLPLKAQPAAYHAYVDLREVKDDKLYVRIETPPIDAQSVAFHMPRIVPGTYSISDFGRFISEIEAKDAQGKVLKIKALDKNRWLISEAQRLKSIGYWIEDTYDTQKDNFIFEPAGTNIEAGENFVVNTHGFFGYLDGYKTLPYRVTFTHDKDLYGSTSMPRIGGDENTDTFEAQSYIALVDHPLMYCKPDTATLDIWGTEVLVSVYSTKGNSYASLFSTHIEDLLKAQIMYMGRFFPVKKYAFIIYLFDRNTGSGSYGALEHAYSSLYSLPEIQADYLSEVIRDVAAHEFFHIITPLSIHSEEIGNFDFINTKMSKHLWMYEGVTEYFAGHMQAQRELISDSTYLETLKDKIQHMQKTYNDTLPFTQMSKECLDKYKDEYQNVYEKGAIIGLCLDIALREQSKGTYGLMNLMQDLSSFYGKDRAFKDEALFDKIVELSYPSIRTFFSRYVEGPEPLPLEATFDKVGIRYENDAQEVPVLGNLPMSESYMRFVSAPFLPEQGAYYIENTKAQKRKKQNAFLAQRDLLYTIDKYDVTEFTPQELAILIRDLASKKKKISFTGARIHEKEAGSEDDGSPVRLEELKGKLKVSVQEIHTFQLTRKEKPSKEERFLYNAWMGK